MNYKDTIFLPITDFQMRGNLSVKEPEILDYWDSIDFNHKSKASSKGREKFILHDGPPFANGTPHAGTAMNKVIKDIIVRMKKMKGYDAPFVPGWDCHGLPIEWKVEEQLREKGIKKDDIPVAQFRDLCKEFALHWIEVQKSGFKRLGVNGDWDNPYLTMNNISEATVIRQIGKFIADGTLYRGEKPVFWSVVEKTALADAEIEYIDKKSSSIYVAFKIKQAKADYLHNAYCVIWTTTPWTIPGNRAISYSKDIQYCLLNAGDKNLVIAKDLIESFASVTEISFTVIREFHGSELDGVICSHPFYKDGYDFDVPLIHGDHVETTAGTGLVHTAPGHGLDDFNVCKKNNIQVPLTVNESGVYYDSVPLFAGKHIFKVETEMLDMLNNVGALLFRTTIVHSYPHSWRSKAPLIFRTTPQWFISLDNTNLRQKAMTEIEKTSWIPKQGYNRIKSFVENRGDWCVSRQRVWGVPLPIFVSKKNGGPLRDLEVINRIADVFEAKGSNAWFVEDPSIFLGDKYDANDFEQVYDTLDVWFESSSTYAYVVKNESVDMQADLYVEGSDQHRGWFQHSLLNSCGTFGGAPFKTVMTHGFIVDEKGRKMSKSLGNTVTLDDVVKNLGADIFRMWVASSDFTQDLKLGANILKQLEDVYRKLRNTLRYMLGALADFDSEKESVEYSQLPDLEKWVLHRLFEVYTECMSCIDSYDINRYFTILHTFCSGDLSSFFFDIRKDCLYCDSVDDIKRRSYRTVLDAIFHHIIRLLSPIIVFTTEEAWLSLFKTSSVHLQTFLKPNQMWFNAELNDKINKVKEIRRVITTALENARKEKIIGSSLQAKVILFDPKRILPLSDLDFWNEVSITSGFEITNTPIPDDAFLLDGFSDIGVIVEHASGEKCERCWKISNELNEVNICKRCAMVINTKS